MDFVKYLPRLRQAIIRLLFVGLGGASKGKGPFEKETISFAKENGIDLILILLTRDISFFDYFMAAREQFIISNPEQIPVLCINPKPARLASGFSASGG
jgi:hypothetical protein